MDDSSDTAMPLQPLDPHGRCQADLDASRPAVWWHARSFQGPGAVAPLWRAAALALVAFVRLASTQPATTLGKAADLPYNFHADG
jgi:hypothetical protein